MSEDVGLDRIIRESLRDFAAEMLVSQWHGKEHDWVNAYPHGYLLKRRVDGSLLYDAAQIAIDVGVAQPRGYSGGAVRRDIVIWQRPRMSCWDESWKPTHHPLAIMEWKVHRPGHPNPDVSHERKWLRRYTAWQPAIVAYAVEVDTRRNDPVLQCHRFLAGREDSDWLRYPGGGS